MDEDNIVAFAFLAAAKMLFCGFVFLLLYMIIWKKFNTHYYITGTIMTTFEITITIIVVIGVLIMALSSCFIIRLLEIMKRWQESIWQELRSIRVNAADTAEYTHNHIVPDVEIITNSFLHLLDEGKGLPALVDIVDKMHRNLCVEIADKMVDRMYKQPTSVNGTPCYAPDGICTNPQMDCINCPKRGTGDTWSTNIVKEE